MSYTKKFYFCTTLNNYFITRYRTWIIILFWFSSSKQWNEKFEPSKKTFHLIAFYYAKRDGISFKAWARNPQWIKKYYHLKGTGVRDMLVNLKRKQNLDDFWSHQKWIIYKCMVFFIIKWANTHEMKSPCCYRIWKIKTCLIALLYISLWRK